MKVNFTLEEKERAAIGQMLEDIPIDICEYVDCPDCIDGQCDFCPLLPISENWSRGLEQLCQQTCEALKKLEK